MLPEQEQYKNLVHGYDDIAGLLLVDIIPEADQNDILRVANVIIRATVVDDK